MLRGALLAFALLIAPAVTQAQAPRSRHLLGVEFTETTTEADIRRHWGEPDDRRGRWDRYRLSSGSELHLMYSPLPPHRLVYADLYGPGRRAGDRLFGIDEHIAAREISQIDPCQTEEGMVVPIWGSPNFIQGEGDRYYALADGNFARFGPANSMRGVAIVNSFDGRVIRDISPNDCPRRALAPAPPPSGNRESVDPFLPPRLLTDIDLVDTLTASDVEALWGTPRPFGTDWHSYLLASGETLALLFDAAAPYTLIYADLYAADDARTKRRLFAHNVRARSRTIEQAACGESTMSRYARWGLPDFSVGSGFVYETYVMANGDEVTFRPDGHRSGCPDPAPRRHR